MFYDYNSSQNVLKLISTKISSVLSNLRLLKSEDSLLESKLLLKNPVFLWHLWVSLNKGLEGGKPSESPSPHLEEAHGGGLISSKEVTKICSWNSMWQPFGITLLWSHSWCDYRFLSQPHCSFLIFQRISFLKPSSHYPLLDQQFTITTLSLRFK